MLKSQPAVWSENRPLVQGAAPWLPYTVARCLLLVLTWHLLVAGVAWAGNGFSVTDVSVAEGSNGNPALVFEVTLQACSLPAPGCSVDVATQNSVPLSAIAGEDYIQLVQTLAFNNGPAGPPQTRLFQVTVDSDAVVELNEHFAVILLNPVGAAIDTSVATGTILNDDFAQVIGNSTIEINEGSVLGVGFSVTSRVDVAVEVQAELIPQTATVGEDFNSIWLVATIPAGMNSGSGILVQTVQESLVELDETFLVSIQSLNALGRAVTIHPTANAQVGRILNDDSATVDFIGVEGVEGDTGTTPFEFTATLSAPVDTAVELDYSTNDGTATTADGDYGAEGSSVILDGVTTVSIFIDVNGDEVAEGTEEFFLDLIQTSSDGRDVVAGITRATGTIIGDDAMSLFVDGFETGDTSAWAEP